MLILVTRASRVSSRSHGATRKFDEIACEHPGVFSRSGFGDVLRMRPGKADAGTEFAAQRNGQCALTRL